MKKIILLSAVALWLLALGGCEKEKIVEYNKVNVTYKQCKHTERYPVSGTINEQEVLLFSADKITENEIIKQLKSDNKKYRYVIYSSEKKQKEFVNVIYKEVFPVRNDYTVYFNFCNFPDIIKELDIPKTGLLVCFSGTTINTNFLAHALYDSYAVILTSLKIEKI